MASTDPDPGSSPEAAARPAPGAAPEAAAEAPPEAAAETATEADQGKDLRAAGRFTLLTVVSRGLGLVRTWAIARVLGGTLGADAYLAAYRLVNFFRLFLGEGALGNAMMPVLKEAEASDPSAARELAARGARLVLVLCFGLLALLLATLDPLLGLYVADMGAAGRAETAAMTWLMSPYLVFIGFVSALMTPLQAMRCFGPTALHPILFSVGVLLGAAASLWYPQPTRALGAGVVLGGLLQALYLAHHARKMGIPVFSSLDLGLSDPRLQEVGRLTLPTLAGVALVRVNSVVDVYFASRLETGSLACMGYANLLYTAFLGMSGMGIATVYFTAMAGARSRGDEAGFARSLGEGGGVLLAITVPATVLGLAFPESLARVFQGGQFGPREVGLTAAAIRGYFLGVAAGGLFQLFSKALYAGKHQALVVRASAAAALLNIALDWALVDGYQVGGLAAATGLASCANVALLGWFLRRELASSGLGAALARTLVPALVAALAGLALPSWARTSPFLLPPAFGLAYLAVLVAWGTPELATLKAMVRRRMPRRDEPFADRG